MVTPANVGVVGVLGLVGDSVPSSVTTEGNDMSETAEGKALRQQVPRSSHADWVAPEGRPSPVEVITSQNEQRVSWLVPIRHHRMAASPFTFYRGAAKLMALDLSTTPSTGITAQICGDAHLSNFGFYGSPERSLVFDLNDFDETLPGPWEWDVKRLAASFVIAARNNGLKESKGRSLAETATSSYRQAMLQLAEMGYLDIWYSRFDDQMILDEFGRDFSKKHRKETDKALAKARKRDSRHVLGKLAEKTDEGYRIISQPPLVIPSRELRNVLGPADDAALRKGLSEYLASVPDDLELLLRRYTFVDFAVKVVGVGSVGTRCFILLLQGRDEHDPLFLQIKEATSSVLEDHLPASRYATAGQRVVEGQRVMQSVSDSFLGWTKVDAGHQYYWRQLKDMKGSAEVEDMEADALERYAKLCGWTLARAHARSADPQLIAGYLGKSDTFDEAIGEFAVSYADQNEADFRAFETAIEAGDIPAHPAVEA
jgi:uncharacterized protein (DUF2252 family)